VTAMAVTLIPVGPLKEYVGGRRQVELAAGPTVTEMLNAMDIPSALVAAVVRDTEIVPKDYRPQDGETIKLITIVGGGW